MAKSKNYQQYPPSYFSILRQIERLGIYQVEAPARKPLESLRFDLYGFSNALRHAGHPDSKLADQISWSIQGLSTGMFRLEGRRRDTAFLAQLARAGLQDPSVQAPESQSAERPGPTSIISPPPTLEPAEDPMESALRKLGFFTGIEKREQSKCPDGLLPDGPVCPRCGGNRGPSGVDGGTWIHYTKDK
jgi:hypothetical protein